MKEPMKDKPRALIEQVQCCNENCGSYKNQILWLECAGKVTLINLLCLTCGLLFNLKLDGSVTYETAIRNLEEQENKSTEKSSMVG